MSQQRPSPPEQPEGAPLPFVRLGPKPSLIEHLLHEDQLCHIWSFLDGFTVTRLARVHPSWNKMHTAPSLWHGFCSQYWSKLRHVPIIGPLAQKKCRAYEGSWQGMFRLKPHVRYDGYYALETRYWQRGGLGFNQRVEKVIEVVYYRYLQFLPNGVVWYALQNAMPPMLRLQPRTGWRGISGNQAVLYKGEYKVVTRSNGHDDGPGTFVLLRVELPHLIAHMKLRVGSMAQHQHDMLSLEAFRGERFPGDPNQIIFDVPHNSFRFWCTPETDSLELNRQILTDLHKKYRPQDALSALLQAELYDHQAQQPNAAAFIDMAPRPAANSRDQKEGGLQEQKQKYPWRSDAIDSLEGSAGPEHVFAEKKGHAHVKPEVGRGEDNALREGTGSSPQRQSKEQRQNKKGQLGLPESNRNMLATGAKAMAGQHLDDSSGKQHISQECKLEAGENVSKNKADKTESSQKKAVRKKNRRRKKQMA